jgi:predicted N-acetyltransferase YhbS
MVQIRPPTPAEFQIARRILSDAHLDPTTPLRIEHTLIAEAGGQVVGVGQIKHHGDCQELGSLVVLPAYQRQGIGAQLIAALEAQAERPLYLTCLKAKEPYYARFGYRRIRYGDMPGYFRRRMPLFVLATLFGFRPRVMRKM